MLLSSPKAQTEQGGSVIKETVEFLRKVGLFKYMDVAAIELIAGKMTLVTFSAMSIVRERESADGLYILRTGAAVVTRSSDSKSAEVVLGHLQTGDSFGEVGLVDGMSQTATVTATEPAQCYFLDRDIFHKLLDKYPEMARGILPALAASARATGNMVGQLLSF